jgi:hypothetical protein
MCAAQLLLLAACSLGRLLYYSLRVLWLVLLLQWHVMNTEHGSGGAVLILYAVEVEVVH